jgi:hypothetical protein
MAALNSIAAPSRRIVVKGLNRTGVFMTRLRGWFVAAGRRRISIEIEYLSL